MKSYEELRALPPDAYLNPENFRTDWPIDHDPMKMEENFQRGLEESRRCQRVYICASGVWGADLKKASDGTWGGLISSYEGIGYHSGTADFWRGVLAGPAEVGVFRMHSENYTSIRAAA